MHIIHFVAVLSNLRGLENQAILQQNYQVKNNYDSQLWTLSIPKNIVRINYRISKQIVFSFLKPKIFFASIFIFLNTIFIRKKTIIHIHGLSEYILPFVMAKFFNRNLTLILKISNSGKKSTFKKIRKKYMIFGDILNSIAVRYIDKWIYINDEIMKELIKEGVKLSNVYSVPNGVEVDLSKLNLKSQFSSSICWIGSLVEHKNIFFLLDIIKLLPEKYTITIYGKGPLFDILYKKVIANSLQDRIFLKGWLNQDELYSQLSKHSIYLSTSFAEGMSNALLESITNKQIPVCLKAPFNEAVLGKEYKFLVDDFNEQNWVRIILSIEEKYEETQKYLYHRIEKFDIRNIVQKLDNVYFF